MFFSGLSSVTVTGRITFALMRDKGFYFADFFSEVRALQYILSFIHTYIIKNHINVIHNSYIILSYIHTVHLYFDTFHKCMYTYLYTTHNIDTFILVHIHYITI